MSIRLAMPLLPLVYLFLSLLHFLIVQDVLKQNQEGDMLSPLGKWSVHNPNLFERTKQSCFWVLTKFKSKRTNLKINYNFVHSINLTPCYHINMFMCLNTKDVEHWCMIRAWNPWSNPLQGSTKLSVKILYLRPMYYELRFPANYFSKLSGVSFL